MPSASSESTATILRLPATRVRTGSSCAVLTIFLATELVFALRALPFFFFFAYIYIYIYIVRLGVSCGLRLLGVLVL